MIRCKFKNRIIFYAAALLIIFMQLNIYCVRNLVEASEFPERECCDPIFPLLPEQIQPQVTTASTSLSSLSTSFLYSSPITPIDGRPGPNIKTAVSILNCILARQLCFEDPSCSAILEIIPRVCGPVPVACSTVTVTKCQAALKTLQAFPFFRPTCLCKEPGADPECNNFRDFLFDHPCGFVLKKEKDPYPVDALPTCNHALSVCQQERKCIKLFENFKTHCKVRENKCRMEDRDLCYESWTNLRLSPMFGCICPNNHMKRRCDRIFSMVNHNPCVDVVLLSPAQDVSKLDNIAPLPSLLSPLAQTSTKKSLTHFFHDDSHNQSQKLSSSNNRMFPIALASHSPEINFYIKTHNRNDTNQKSPQINPLLTISTNSKEHDSRTKNLNTNLHNHNSNNNNNNNNNGNKNSSRNNTAYDNKNNNYKINNNTNNNNNNKLPKNRHRHLNKNTEYYQSTWNPPHNIMEIVQSISVDDTSYHQHLFDENMALIEMPLIAPVSMHYPHHRHNVYYPYNITGFQNQIHQHFDNTDGGTISSVERHQSAPDLTPDTHTEIIRIHFQSTCHTALDACREDQSCASSVQPVMQHCDLHRCNRNACMDALQSFYRGSHEDLSLDVAFCLCKKTSNRHDVCMIAQEKLHPVCAQRPPDTLNTQTSNGAMYHPPPACNVVADLCKEDEECRARLEHYEQACAVDSVTKKCAGRTSSCRSAMLGILGTPLRTSCACQGADVQQLYECLGWHRLLWINPCVVESQKDFHMKRLAELGLLITSTTSTTTRQPTTLATTHITMGSIAVQRPTRPPTIFIPKSIIIESIPPTEQALENNYIELPLPDSIPETLLYGNEQNENISRMGAAASGEKLLVLFTNSTTMEIETTSTTTTTTTMASTAAPRFCVVQRPQQSDQLIPESSTRRIYSLDDAECSELCSCANTLTLTCHALCVPFAPCRTKLAYYNHASPAYQAYRGRCLCYSGRFICMKPPIGDYSLPGGIFLFLGYSSTDEALLRPYTNLGIQDTIRVLQHYVNKHISNQTACTLNLFNMTDENIIISARLPHDSKITPMELLRNEKAQCTPILETISHQVNSQHSELAAQRLLSIFKMAEVETVLPDVSHACRQLLTTKHTFSFSIISVVIYLIMPLLVRWSYHIQLVQWT